jgi:hypothetical protein
MAQTISPQLHVSHNPMASYAEQPAGVYYQDQEPGEQVKVLLRRHMATNSGWLLASAVGLVIPPILALIHPGEYIGFEWTQSIPSVTVLLLTLFWYVLVLGFALESFLIWYYNVYLVTNERLVDVDFIGLMHYSASEAGLRQIQDVEHMQEGLPQLLFGYGKVEAQTAGTRQNLVFEKVPHPSRVADIITDLLPRTGEVQPSASANPDTQATSTVQPEVKST